MGKLKLGEIITLLKAGYTKEEISEFKNLEMEDPEEPAAAPEEPEEPEEPSQHYVDDIAKLNERVETLTNMLQDQFRKDAEGSGPVPAAGDDILKDILEKGFI